MKSYYRYAFYLLLVLICNSCNEQETRCVPPPCPRNAAEPRLTLQVSDQFTDEELNKVVINRLFWLTEDIFDSFQPPAEMVKSGLILGEHSLFSFISHPSVNVMPEFTLSIQLIIGENQEFTYLIEEPGYILKDSAKCQCPEYYLKTIKVNDEIIEFENESFFQTLTIEKY